MICIFSDLDSVLMQKFIAAFGQANDTAIVLCSVLLVPISLFFPLVPFCCDSLLIYKTCYDDNVSEIKLQSYVTINKKTLSTLTNKCNNWSMTKFKGETHNIPLTPLTLHPLQCRNFWCGLKLSTPSSEERGEFF